MFFQRSVSFFAGFKGIKDVEVIISVFFKGFVMDAKGGNVGLTKKKIM